MKDLFTYLKDLIYPEYLTCILCKEELMTTHKHGICPDCEGAIQFQIGHACRICGRMLPSSDRYGVCSKCKELNRHMDGGSSVVVYDEQINGALFQLKYKKKNYLAKALANLMVDKLVQMDLPFELDYVTAVPMFDKKEKRRGYNQATLLAQAIARRTGLAYRDCLSRQKDTPPLKAYAIDERQSILSGAFEMKAPIDGNVLLVDDIITSGHTLNECAIILKEAGAQFVFTMTFAASE